MDGKGSLQRLQVGQRVVGGGVVDHHDLQLRVARVLDQAREQPLQVLAAVARGHDRAHRRPALARGGRTQTLAQARGQRRATRGELLLLRRGETHLGMRRLAWVSGRRRRLSACAEAGGEPAGDGEPAAGEGNSWTAPWTRSIRASAATSAPWVRTGRRASRERVRVIRCPRRHARERAARSMSSRVWRRPTDSADTSCSNRRERVECSANSRARARSEASSSLREAPSWASARSSSPPRRATDSPRSATMARSPSSSRRSSPSSASAPVARASAA